MDVRYIYSPNELEALCGLTVGGKAEGLLRLGQAGLPVPQWLVVPAEVSQERPWRQSGKCGQFLECFRTLARVSAGGVAVRSSAAGEDAAAASHAGIYETRFALDENSFLDALDQVMDAADSEQAQRYRGLDTKTRMAIVLQKAVHPRLAGVLFSANPAAALPEQFCVEAVCGRGDGLVDGSKTPSRGLVSIETGTLQEFLPGSDGPEQLDGGILNVLRTALLHVEKIFDAPVDIEWSIDGDGLWLLQARPITALRAHESLRPEFCASSWFFDQRFSEPVTPLTRTTLLPIILRTAVEDALRMRKQTVPPQLLHFFAGQAYVAHEAYRRMFAGAPKWLLSGDLRQLFPERCACNLATTRSTAIRYLAGAMRAIAQYPGDALLNLRSWDRFRRELPVLLSRIPHPPPRDSHAWIAAWRALDRLNERFLQLHRWSLLWADYGYRIYRLILRGLPRGPRGLIERRLHDELKLVTSEANAALVRIVSGVATKTEVADFLEQFGHRSTSLDYAVPTWREWHAEGVLHLLYPIASLRAPTPTADRAPKRGLLSKLLGPLRRALEMRESQRFEWERILARQRAMLLEAGATLTGRGVLSKANDIWLLKWPEVFECLEGREGPNGITLELRRHTLRLESRLDKPPFIGPITETQQAANGRELRGIGASGGVARGRVRVLRGPARLLPPAPEPIVAVLTALDPSWTVILPQVAGLVVERGGMLSHAAILAREYGVPMVIGVHDAVSIFREDDDVSINGETGVVTMLGGRE